MEISEIIDRLKDSVVQIATPFSSGTGFYVKDFDLIVSNEHVVRNNRFAVILGQGFKKQLTEIVFFDEVHDLAFLRAPKNHRLIGIESTPSQNIVVGEQVISVGHPFGFEFSATKGIVSSLDYRQHDISFIQHDASLNPGNSGGPLMNSRNQLVGVNTFVLREGHNLGFSLPSGQLHKSLKAFKEADTNSASICIGCSGLVRREDLDQEDRYCPSCGKYVVLPVHIEGYEPTGVKKTLEDMISDLGFDIELARKGPNQWEIKQGSAKVNISYHESTGLITCDAYLCQLPLTDVDKLYRYILKENFTTSGHSFSVRGNDIVLSLLIYDQYLDIEIGRDLMERMFQKADDYDDILIDEYGALPIVGQK